MGKRSVSKRKRDVLDSPSFQKKYHLLKHLRKSRFTVSETLHDEIVEDDPDEHESDLQAIPTSSYDLKSIRSFIRNRKYDKKNELSEEKDLQHFLTADKSRSASIIFPGLESSFTNSRRRRSRMKSLDSAENCKARNLDFHLPTITEMEESGLKAFYFSILNSATWQISNLNVKPGDNHFIFWFFVSSYIPLLASCSGPLSNIFSLMAIICSWKINIDDPTTERDPVWCYSINSISIVFAIFSNIFLLLNYRKKIRYTYCQIISISGWGIACVILTALLIGYRCWYSKNKLYEQYKIGYGFYFACITVVIHFLNFVMLSLNEIGFLKKKYKPVFNIDHVQETLVIQTTSMCVWIIAGAAIFTKILDMNLGESMFYAVSSLVTIGLQSEVPTNNPLAQTLTSIWIVFGLVMFGLIIGSIRQMMIEFSSSTLCWHRLEYLRRNVVNQDRFYPENMTSFKLINKLHNIAYTIQGVYEISMAVTIFMVTLLCGALGFTLFEGWSYSSSVYFCFYNLMTLGQGNQIPETPGGKVFYSAWALGAIPVMTILVSTSSDFIFSKLTHFEEVTFLDGFVEYCLSHSYLKRIGEFLMKKDDQVLTNHDLSLYRTKSKLLISNKIEKKEYTSHKQELYDQLRSLSSNTPQEYKDKVERRDTNDTIMLEDLQEADPENRVTCYITDRFDLSGKNNQKKATVFESESYNPVEDFNDISVPKKDRNLPVLCHPVDMLYSTLLESNRINDYGFVNAEKFVNANIKSIHLANYFRDGQYVDIDISKLQEARIRLINYLKSVDDKFDVQLFQETYNLEKLVDENGIDRVSVVQADKRIHTGYKKKNDYVLHKLSRIQVILMELKQTVLHMCHSPDREYSYEEWQDLFQIINNQDGLHDNQFWVKSKSPLAFPMKQPNYFSVHYIRQLEMFIQEFAAEWDGYEDVEIGLEAVKSGSVKT